MMARILLTNHEAKESQTKALWLSSVTFNSKLKTDLMQHVLEEVLLHPGIILVRMCETQLEELTLAQICLIDTRLL